MHALTRSEYTERLIQLKGKPFSFDQYPFLRDPYDITCREVLLKAGRQVAKSTTLCNVLLTEMLSIPFFQSFYVSPTNLQTRRFSNQRLLPSIKYSPIINKYFTNSSTIQNVFEKTLTNGACMNLSNAFQDADAIRGISADRLCIDECQDILWDTVPVIKETMAASKYKWVLYAGTPKTLDNTIEKLWENSNQCVWCTTCTGCNHENVPGMDNIGETCYVCSKCKKPIDLHTGTWRALNPGATRVALHIPQIIRPDLDWEDLQEKLKEYPEGKIRNEILGEPFDSGQKPITAAELMACCGDYLPTPKKIAEHGISHMYGGLDWAITAGYSLFVAGGMDTDNKFRVIFAKKYSQTDPRIVIDDVVKLCGDFNIEYLGADRGAGHTNNLLLMERLTWTKVVEFSYQARLKEGMKWHQGNRSFLLDRTIALDSTFYKLRTQKILFPTYESFGRHFFPDILCIFTEFNDYLKKIEYKHSPDSPDDFMHSLTYMLHAFQIAQKLAGRS